MHHLENIVFTFKILLLKLSFVLAFEITLQGNLTPPKG